MSNERPHYSCSTAAGTLQWMNSIAEFLRPFKPLLDAHVVNFFKDRLWELLPPDWIDCLRGEPVQNLLSIPSGISQDHWPTSLQEYAQSVKSLALSREPELSGSLLSDMHVEPLGSVLVQGMNAKKLHEVEILAAAVNYVASRVGAPTVIDVGAGQGYLAQALSFQYQLSVIAIDASSHHSSVTFSRAERIKKHYAAKLLKSGCANTELKVPRTVTCRLLSSDALTTLTASIHAPNKKLADFQSNLDMDMEKSNGDTEVDSSYVCHYGDSSMVLVGLHACGDLSVNMLRTFVECAQVKAVVCIGCCYNLLSEKCLEATNHPYGFPMSKGAKQSAFKLGKNTCDLGCQSAERWGSLANDAALQNFELHAFRAAFQMVLDKYYPETIKSSPSIGRQGKSLRRQQLRRHLQSQLNSEENRSPSIVKTKCCQYDAVSNRTILSGVPDRYTHFEEYSITGLKRLGIELSEDVNLLDIWKAVESYIEFVGPFWSLRAALGPLVETYILLDRLLYLQEHGTSVRATLTPLFNPTLSPRNVAILAEKEI